MPIAFSADGRTLAARSQDGVDLLALPSGKLKASLFSFGGGKELDWLVITPDGRFDGTPVAWKDLAWRLSPDTFDRLPVEVFFRDFYRPGLLADVLSDTPPQAPQDIAVIDRRQPKVHLEAAIDSTVPVVDRLVSLTLTVEEAARDAHHAGSSGARDLRLFRNGTLVQTWRGALGSKGKKAVSLSARVPIVAGPNRFSAYAFSDSGVKSADAELAITGADSLSRKGTAYVIAMGIDHYAADTPQDRLDLQYAEADASAFIQEFTKAQKALDRYARVRVVRLLGDVGTRANLNAVLTKLGGSPASGERPAQLMLLSALRAVEPEDGVFLFYAGHGAAENGHFYLLPQDYNPLQPLANSDSRAVSELDLSQWLEGIAPERSFLILDACRSGQAIDSNVPLGPLNASGLAQLAYEKGIYILAASKDSESALEAEKFGGGHGLLTYALVEEGLRDGAAAQNGAVELRHWFLYASQRVPDLQAAQSRERRAALINSAPALPPAAGQHPRLLYRREPEVDPFVVATFSQSPEPAAAH